MANRLGAVGARGSQALSRAIASIIQRQKAEELAAQQREYEMAQDAIKNKFTDRQIGLGENRFGFEQGQWAELGPQRAANLEGTLANTESTRASTAATNQGMQFRGEDRAEAKRGIDLLPIDVAGVPLRTIAGLRRVGVDVDPNELLTPQQQGQRAGQATGAAWDTAGRRVAQEGQNIDTQGAIAVNNAKPATGQNLSANQELLAINRLQKEWKDATANAAEMRRQHGLMQAGLAAAKAGDMAAGSQAVLVTFQKILDPTSVVRESEYARSASGQSALNQIQGFYERLAKGGAGVPVSELEKFANLAATFVEQSQSGLSGRRARLERMATSYNLDPSLIFDDAPMGTDPSASTPAGPAARPRFSILSVK